MDKMKLKQLFANNADCYADTWHAETDLVGSKHVFAEGEVIPAMTEEKFVEVVSALFPTDQEITAMAEKEYPVSKSDQVEAYFDTIERTAYINGCNAIIKRGKDE